MVGLQQIDEWAAQEAATRRFVERWLPRGTFIHAPIPGRPSGGHHVHFDRSRSTRPYFGPIVHYSVKEDGTVHHHTIQPDPYDEPRPGDQVEASWRHGEGSTEALTVNARGTVDRITKTGMVVLKGAEDLRLSLPLSKASSVRVTKRAPLGPVVEAAAEALYDEAYGALPGRRSWLNVPLATKARYRERAKAILDAAKAAERARFPARLYGEGSGIAGYDS